ncbi:MAG: GNAT family N-acetyltransferase, partial [Clostridiales bacterium]|nr:GNAT family N-acetyltransferase [Clostridiales bacterium]
MVIKQLREEYIDDVVKIEKECFSVPWSKAALEAELKNEFSKFFVAVENGKAIGYTGIYVLTGEADIVRVAVLFKHLNCQVKCNRVSKKTSKG